MGKSKNGNKNGKKKTKESSNYAAKRRLDCKLARVEKESVSTRSCVTAALDGITQQEEDIIEEERAQRLLDEKIWHEKMLVKYDQSIRGGEENVTREMTYIRRLYRMCRRVFIKDDESHQWFYALQSGIPLVEPIPDCGCTVCDTHTLILAVRDGMLHYDPKKHNNKGELVRRVLVESMLKRATSQSVVNLTPLALSLYYGAHMEDYKAERLTQQHCAMLVRKTEPLERLADVFSKRIPIPEVCVACLFGMVFLYGSYHVRLAYKNPHLGPPFTTWMGCVLTTVSTLWATTREILKRQ